VHAHGLVQCRPHHLHHRNPDAHHHGGFDGFVDHALDDRRRQGRRRHCDCHGYARRRIHLLQYMSVVSQNQMKMLLTSRLTYLLGAIG
jgi:hypothetical protein